MKNYRTAWTISLLVIACINIISLVTSWNGINLSDTLIRILGVLGMCAVVVLVYTSVKLRIWKKR
ncbi:MAG: hypothetical protein IKF00_11820 [Solobacterium sp.]|nr:hypothetical protein [Solobacterium sp.]